MCQYLVGVSKRLQFLGPKILLQCLRGVLLLLITSYVQACEEMMKTSDFRWKLWLVFAFVQTALIFRAKTNPTLHERYAFVPDH